ncbi:hypothetical protein ACVGVM_25380 [Pseudonocardia bannensis]|uniref:Uncharacterized protein n=1 Tax=Pseudonocardia bannensis TaxID=630973 RepID=A0A848DKY5_9PSEU|nr:hypothetical protein [Pseudonocardia bannensis]NMH93074.1 hypothetical protein [Pseudonocardia bannensis]
MTNVVGTALGTGAWIVGVLLIVMAALPWLELLTVNPRGHRSPAGSR